MAPLFVLMFFPIVPAVLLFAIRHDKARSIIAGLSSVVIAALSIVVSVLYFNERVSLDLSRFEWVSYCMTGIEICMSLYIVYVGARRKSRLAPLFTMATTLLLIWFELTNHITVHKTLILDKLSVLMILIIGVIGGLICLYATRYMKDYHSHDGNGNSHVACADRRGMFFLVLYLFLSAMFGLVLFNHFLWMFFCWEITTFCSFLLIGYTKSKEAEENSMRALTINTGGGLTFAIGIVILAVRYKVLDFDSLLSVGNYTGAILAPLFLLGVASLTKSAQLPFSKWLLGAMVAPTPTSAMLHSSTMVKAGVYLLIRLSPMLSNNYVGVTLTLVGGFTFLMTALIAISQSDAKKILAYSTISNLGLIVACASIGTAESIWAGVMLTVFHALSKSLLFLTVGSAEHQLGSRNVEDMDGLVKISGTLSMLFVIGIAGMFLAPFGMLISKWAAMRAFIDSGNMLIVIMVAFGSSVTLFFWTKWLGKLIGNYSSAKISGLTLPFSQEAPLITLAILVVAVCMGYPWLSTGLIIPYLQQIQFLQAVSPISQLNNTIVLFMMGALFLLPILLIPIYKRNPVKTTSLYLSGQNTGDDQSFYGSVGQIQPVRHRNWYMKRFFGEDLLFKDSAVLSAVLLGTGAVILFATAILKLGG